MIKPAAALGLALAAAVAAQQPKPDHARGAYLVHIAQCAACHSPRDTDGQPLPDRALHGAAVPFDSPYPSWAWASRAPALAGLPGWNDDDAVRFLMTGVVPRDGRRPRRPMPAYRFNERDARDVVAYLRGLK